MKLASLLTEIKTVKAKLAVAHTAAVETVCFDTREPAPDFTKALAVFASTNARLQTLTAALYRANLETKLPSGITILEGLIKRDKLKAEHAAYAAMYDASAGYGRQRGYGNQTEVIMLVNPATSRDGLQGMANQAAKALRELEEELQSTNWLTDVTV
jgi:hypothetical protein